MSEYAHNDVQIVPIDSIRGAEYNPRKMVPERLEHVARSLKTLGFVLPIYATSNGVILSGHQRTRAAKMAGFTHVPVVVVDTIPDAHEKGMNLVFNRATNDMDCTSTKATQAFDQFLSAVNELGESGVLSELPVDTFPCIENIRKATVKEFLPKVPMTTNGYLRGGGLKLIQKKIYMPLVVCGDEIINGLIRFYSYADAGYEFIDVVEVPPEKKEYAYWALNFLAMDFDLQTHFADELRFNAFRRTSVQAGMVGFSRTYSFFPMGRTVRNGRGQAGVAGQAMVSDLDLLPHLDEEVKAKYKKTYGNIVCDMGAGTFHDSNLLRQAGFDVIAFEPYVLDDGKGVPNRDTSREKALEWLGNIERLTKEGLDSIISSYNLNSIPHHKDRMAFLCIIAALCRVKTKVFIGTQHVTARSKGVARDWLDPNMEPNMTLGDDLRSFKAQKYFYEDELEKMLKVFFSEVKVGPVKEFTLYATARFPKRVNPKLLREAIELEFNLPYADGRTMDLVEEACKVIGAYAGVDLSKPSQNAPEASTESPAASE